LRTGTIVKINLMKKKREGKRDKSGDIFPI
jgi:hypothetical protein